jgi:3-phosphoshikimate 1-carboxyvinyltransferase
MLSAPQLPKGLKINFTTETTSLPYLEMTVQMMQNLGIKIEYGKDFIQVMPTKAIRPVKIAVESDWSSASYFYSLVALSPDLKLSLNTFKEESLQGDSELAEIYKQFGVKTPFLNNAIELELNKGLKSSDKSIFQLNLNASPDLAQTIAVTCLGLNIPCNLTGLHTLKIKETDRLLALKIELEKLGAKVNIGDDFLFMEPGMSLIADQHIDTYNDHRMAMAFAPLMTKTSLVINNAEVVSKSYRGFWQDLIKISG